MRPRPKRSVLDCEVLTHVQRQAWTSCHSGLSPLIASGALLGGLVGEVCLGWLSIDALWVTEMDRGQGTGSALLGQAERRAVELGAVAAYLDTSHW